MRPQNISVEEFLSCYNLLQNNDKSAEANKKLMQIERSEESWEIAKSLTLNPEHTVHGCQWLSKKLNEPYTLAMDSQLRIVDFILGQKSLNQLLRFSLAKLALHLNWEVLDLRAHNTPINILGVLKQIPSATLYINLFPEPKQINERIRAEKIFQKYKGFLIQSFNQFPEEVQQCLENFASNNFKISSDQLFKLLLSRPLSEIKNTLQKILEGQKYENLSNQIFTYLLNNESQTERNDFLVVFLIFVRSLPILALQTETLTGILYKILSILKTQNTLNSQQKKKVYYIVDSFDFWFDISNKLIEARGRSQNSPQIEICLSAFVQLWKIVIERCLESEMPPFKYHTQEKQNMIICLDSDEDLGESSQIKFPDFIPSKFRQTGEDFLQMIFSTISKSQQHKNLCLSAVFDLTNSTNPLNLQLAIYVMSCIVDIAGQNTMKQISAVIRSITANQNTKNPYIWQQLIRLLGKLGHEAVCEDDIFQTALLVLKQSFLIQELMITAGQNFNQILVTCSNSSQKAKQTPILQQFFDFIYGNIYFKTDNQKVFKMLTKSTIIFIYNFRPDLDYFKDYLHALNQKIQALAKLQDKLEIVDDLALGHMWISSDISRMFTPLVSQFFAAFLPVVIAYISQCPTKKLSPVFCQLSTLVISGSGYNTQVWVQAFIQLSQIPNVMKQKQLIINLFIKLMQVDQYDQQNYKPAVLNLIKGVEQFVLSCLESSTQNDYKLINKCLTFHFILLSKYVSDISNYNPDRLLGYIVGNFFEGEMKFQFESCRTSLAIIRSVMQKGYRVQELLEQVLKVYPKIVDIVWKSIQSILYEAYKQGGSILYQKAFANVYPAMLPPNPLFEMFVKAISESNSKDFKNLLANLK